MRKFREREGNEGNSGRGKEMREIQGKFSYKSGAMDAQAVHGVENDLMACYGAVVAPASMSYIAGLRFQRERRD
jgi:hypothetical protein